MPNWEVGDVITFGRGDQARDVGIQWDGLVPELELEGVLAIFTVEPLGVG